MPAIPGGRGTPKKDLGDRKCPGKPYLFKGSLFLRTVPHVPGGRLHLWETWPIIYIISANGEILFFSFFSCFLAYPWVFCPLLLVFQLL